jgi:hypothetical protein
MLHFLGRGDWHHGGGIFFIVVIALATFALLKATERKDGGR